MSGLPMKQWEKAATGSGVVYYVNHADKKTQWEHPNYQVMLEMLDDCNGIKYAAYRTASKLSVLQRFFSMNQVQVKCIAGVFEKHQMHVTENSLELSSSELEDIIYDILYATQTSCSQPSVMNVDLNTELVLNFLLSVFDSSKRKSVKVLCAKVVLTILSGSTMQDKIHYLFEQLSDHNHCISRRKMESFLQSCSSLMYYLAESLAFSCDLIKPTLRQCFQGNDKFVGMSEDVFVRWFLSEPQIIIWFPIFYRLKTAENELHLARCAVCKITPIRGLRYKCLRCINYDQCQNCFFNRRISRRHKLRHPMQEYCWASNSNRSTLEYLKTLIKRICGHESRLQYLPVEPCDVIMESSIETNVNTNEFDTTTQTLISECSTFSTTIKPENELSNIIGLLENENIKLGLEISNLNTGNVNQYLVQHKQQIRNQIQRLRKVKTHLNMICSQPVTIKRMQSTPMIKYNQDGAHINMPSFDNILSPINSSDTSISHSPEISISPHTSASSHDSSSFSSRVTPNDISTWIGKKKLSPNISSHNKFDFSMLLCPKQVSSYRVISDETDKENIINETNSKRTNQKNEIVNETKNRHANSSFSLDEVLAQYECDSRFTTFNENTQKSLNKTKSLFDISTSNKNNHANISSSQNYLLGSFNKIPSENNITQSKVQHDEYDNAYTKYYKQTNSLNKTRSCNNIITDDENYTQTILRNKNIFKSKVRPLSAMSYNSKLSILSNTNLSERNISQRDLSSKNISERDLSGRNISERDLSGRNISERDLSSRNKSERDLSGRNKSERDLSGRNISERDLSSRNMSERDLSSRNKSERDLSGRNMSERDLSSRNKSERDLSGRNMSERDLSSRNKSERDLSRNISNTTSCEDLIANLNINKSIKSLNSQDYLNRIAISCKNMYSLPNSTETRNGNPLDQTQQRDNNMYSLTNQDKHRNMSTENQHRIGNSLSNENRDMSSLPNQIEHRTRNTIPNQNQHHNQINHDENQSRGIRNRKESNCQDRIRKRTIINSNNNLSLSSNTLPRMFKTSISIPEKSNSNNTSQNSQSNNTRQSNISHGNNNSFQTSRNLNNSSQYLSNYENISQINKSLKSNNESTSKQEKSISKNLNYSKSSTKENISYSNNENISQINESNNKIKDGNKKKYRTPFQEKNNLKQSSKNNISHNYISKQEKSVNVNNDSNRSFNNKLSKSNDCLNYSVNKMSSLSNSSYDLLSNSQNYEEWRCDSLNCLLSQDGVSVIEKSICKENISQQDEQVFQLQNEIDNILIKLKTIIATV